MTRARQTGYPRWLLQLQLGWLCGACAVGAPLVDDQSVETGIGPIECNPPPGCDPPTWEEPDVTAAEPLDFEGCPQSQPCVSATNPDGESSRSASCGTESTQALPLLAECSVQLLQAVPDLDELSYEGVEWRTFELSIESQAPLRVELRSPQLHDVTLHVTGPVALHLIDAELDNVQIDALASGDAEPSLELLRVHARLLRLGRPDSAFEGSVVVRASELREIDLQSSAFASESSTLEQGFLRVQRMSAIDTTLSALDIQAAERSVLAEFSSIASRLRLCGYVSLVSGHFNGSTLEGCDSTLVRLYSSTFNSGTLDGRFESDQSSIENTMIGAATDTEILSFDTRLHQDSLCSGAVTLALNDTSRIKCSDCDPAFEQADPTCALPHPPGAESPVESNYCPVLPQHRDLPACDPSLPERSRRR